ncbi:sensor histidine kinase [Nocardiopsis sp. RSe5-2]|uniref:histidine kinase n=1 Tax=Nocardiopsis endophytica TaxID=3018445 RepID=A0ABT4U604_9ACTN|nr:sensor histidine kinase [Nocardiopsis endophytica]MDA2811880.1 sensor histidine kinase [Nocardiopsis endophytica]
MTPFLERLRAAFGPGAGRKLALDVPLGLLLAIAGTMALAAKAAGPPWERGPGNGPPGPPDGFGPGAGPPPWADIDLPVLPLVCVAAVAVCVALRRIWPRSAFVASAAACTVFVGAAGFHGPILAGMLLTLYTMASRMAPREWLPWTAAGLPLLLTVRFDQSYLGLLEADTYLLFIPYTAMMVAAAALGATVRGRREGRRREHDQALRRSAYEERLRIAREVHDVVGHSLSVINMQAGVAMHVLDKRPDRARESLDAIRRTSKDALEELRGTLAVFREGAAGTAGDRAPLPGLDRVGDLAAGMASAGVSVEVHTEGEQAVPPAAVDHAAYRIVQEALTNVARHAPGASASVRIAYERGEVAVEIEDDGPRIAGPGPAEGSGIAGMRERARAVGGNLHAGPRPDGGFAVRARLPLGAPRSGR